MGSNEIWRNISAKIMIKRSRRLPIVTVTWFHAVFENCYNRKISTRRAESKGRPKVEAMAYLMQAALSGPTKNGLNSWNGNALRGNDRR